MRAALATDAAGNGEDMGEDLVFAAASQLIADGSSINVARALEIERVQ